MINLVRKIYTNNSTIGQLTMDDFSCWTLEPSARKIQGEPTCIPAGEYKLEWRWSNKNNAFVPGLLNVPGYSDIEIHPGNEEDEVKDDSLGCILPGMNHAVDWVSNSRDACTHLFPRIQTALKYGDLFIRITGGSALETINGQ